MNDNKKLMPFGGPFTLLKMTFQYGGVHPSRAHRFLLNFFRLLINYPWVLLERYFFQRKIDKIQITETPVFIIGHFRSGTSLMYKLMVTDPRWRFINEYELVFPHHAVWMEKILKPILQKVIHWFGAKHPNFNDYTINLDDPNEDEALLVSGGASWGAYWSYIFTSHSGEIFDKTVTFKNDPDRSLWKMSYLFYLKKLLWRKKGRLLIKSPLSTARIGPLIELFPQAKFIYLHRNPSTVVKSMEKIWREEILKYFCFQKPTQKTITQQINYTHRMLLDAFERDKHLIGNGNLIEVKYEDFMADQFSTIEMIYRQFQFPFGETVKKLVLESVLMQRNYKESKYQEGQV
jgi:omega-hydroxy-beta-dihydromenaquinone-9 sulfotransferase